MAMGGYINRTSKRQLSRDQSRKRAELMSSKLKMLQRFESRDHGMTPLCPSSFLGENGANL